MQYFQTIMCWLASFSGIRRKDNKMPFCFNIEVLSPKRDPLQSVFSVIKAFGQSKLVR
jgi:hypothetical protein